MCKGPTNPNEPFFDKGLWGFDGSVWRKQGVIWSYRDIWRDKRTFASAGDPETELSVVTPPSGEVYTLEGWNISHSDDVARVARLEVFITGYPLIIWASDGMAPDVIIYGVNSFTLRSGCTVRLIVEGLATGKELFISVWGVMMKVDM